MTEEGQSFLPTHSHFTASPNLAPAVSFPLDYVYARYRFHCRFERD